MDALLVTRDLVESQPDLGGGRLAVSGKVEQAILLAVEPGELLAEVVARGPDRLLVVGKRCAHRFAHGGEHIGWYAQRVVLAGDCLLYQIGREVRQVTFTLLASAAEEVRVAGAVAASRFGVDHAMCAPGVVTAITEEVPLQVVVEDSVTVAAFRPLFEHVLYAVKQLARHDRGMPAGVLLAVEHRDPGVVRVAQDAPQLLQ